MPTPSEDDSDDLEQHADWPSIADWIEKQAIDSLKARFATAEIIAKEAQTTLTVLLAGLGASAASAAKVFEPGTPEPFVLASAVTCVYFAWLCIALVIGCMMFQSYPALAQEPANLMQPGASLVALKTAELKNLDARIKDAKSINDARARRLNLVRFGAVGSVIVFGLVGALAPRPVHAPLASVRGDADDQALHGANTPALSQPCQQPTWLIDGCRVGASALPSHSHDCAEPSTTGRSAIAEMLLHWPGHTNQKRRWPDGSTITSNSPRSQRRCGSIGSSSNSRSDRPGR